MKLSIICFLTLLFISACNKKTEIYPQIRVTGSSTPTEKGSRMDDYFSDPKFVPLQTNDSSIIAKISKIYILDSTIVIGDFEQGKILFFSMDGSFLNCIHQQGKGPCEYVQIADFTIDRDKKTVIIMDIGGRRMQHYHFNGEHIQEMPLLPKVIGNLGYKMEHFKHVFLFDRINNVLPEVSGYDLTIVNNDLGLVKAACNIPKQLENLGMTTGRSCDVEEEQVYFNPSGNDTLFVINESLDVQPLFVFRPDDKIDLKKSSLWNNHSKSISNFRSEIAIKGLFGEINRIFMFPRHMLFQYYAPFRSVGIYDKSKNNTITIANPVIFNDQMLFNPIGKAGKKLIIELGINENFMILNEIDPSLKLSPESNPVLCFLELK